MSEAWRLSARSVALTLALGVTLAAAQPAGNAASGTSGSKEPRAAPSSGARDAADSSARQAAQRMHRASRIIGTDVMNRQGEKVGDIEDIVLDRNGNVAYAIVSTGGFLGLGERLHAIPWRSLEASPGTDRFLLDIDRDRLARAPGFDHNSFPDVSDARWSAENKRHFPAARSAVARSSTDPVAPRKKEPDDAHGGSGRPAGNDIGVTAASSRRSGPAAGSGSPPTPDAGSTTGTAAGAAAVTENGGRQRRDQPGHPATGSIASPSPAAGAMGSGSATSGAAGGQGGTPGITR